ncbi:MAG: M15 family metallopeptidase, partial [Verrucomicrobiota bacterium]
NPRFVANPLLGASMHTRGVAVDATLVDRFGRELLMPTDFDAFSEAARRVYLGGDQSVGRNLALLQAAMARAGFLGMEEEWWHFVAKDHFLFDAIPDDSLVDSVTMTLKP